MYQIYEIPKEINIGRQGETGILTLEFDVSSWLAEWSNGTITATYINPATSGVVPLPTSQAYLDGNIYKIEVLRNLTVYPGRASVNIRLTVGDDVEKHSAVFYVVVESSHSVITGEMPDVLADWINDYTEKWLTVDGSATTVEAGNPAAASVTQDEDGTHFAFVVPQGIQGETGPQGIQGETGPQGIQGDAFEYSDFTSEQLAALTGPQGIQGETGPQGIQGDAFEYSDFTSEQLAALTGPQGIQGETGPQGIQGDAFEYSDFTSEQLAALTGPQGIQGETGPQGIQGETGPQGIPGDLTMAGLLAADGTGSELDADLLDGQHAAAFAAASHPHGNITSDGKVGTVADKTLMTGTDGLVVARTMAEAISIWKFTNPNLLHNCDFRNPINQRAVSGAISTGGYFYDRWIMLIGTVTTNAAYLTIGAGAVIEQRIEGNLLAGKIVTVSVMVSGEVYSGTGTMPISTGTASVTLAGWGTATLGYAAGYMYVRLSPTAASNVERVKLELGTVSTLAYDPPMEYGTELLKCQRYYYFILGLVFAYGWAEGATNAWVYLPLPCLMRIVPSFIHHGGVQIIFKGDGTATAASITTTYMRGAGLAVFLASSGLTQYNACTAYLDDQALELSADL